MGPNFRPADARVPITSQLSSLNGSDIPKEPQGSLPRRRFLDRVGKDPGSKFHIRHGGWDQKSLNGETSGAFVNWRGFLYGGSCCNFGSIPGALILGNSHMN